MFEKLDAIEARYDELNKLMAVVSPDDLPRYGRELASLNEVVDLARQYKTTRKEIEDTEGMLPGEQDEELRELAKEELQMLHQRLEGLEDSLKLALVPRDPNDDKNVIVEVRAGAGGDEAAIFAADLYRMYTHYAESHRWGVELMSASENGVHGFKEVINKIGGIWMDVDRRYYNKNTGSYLNDYANINLQPGYQRLTGQQALDFVRFRHTDSDFYRLARQQQFVRAFKEQISQQFHPTSLPGILSAITQNVEVGVGGSSALSGKTVLSYALFAYALPPGHFFQAKFQNLGQDSSFDVLASQSDVQNAIDDFQHPDIEASKVATAVALGNKVKTKAPPPETVRVTVLNGNGVPGSAGNAAFQLAQHGYKIVTPSVSANAPAQDYFHSKVYFDPARKGAKAAAKVLQTLFQPADLEPMPPEIGPISPGAAVDVVVGTTFHGTIGGAPAKSIPKRSPPNVVLDRAPTQRLLAPLARRVPFKLEAPTMIERSSVLDAEKPVRLYAIKKGEKAVRLVYRTGATEYWGIEETAWDGAPVLSDRNFHRALGGRVFDLYFNGPHLHMAVLRANGATYWVVNTLLDSLSNETMLAIAKGLKPLTPGR